MEWFRFFSLDLQLLSQLTCSEIEFEISAKTKEMNITNIAFTHLAASERNTSDLEEPISISYVDGFMSSVETEHLIQDG